MRQDIEQQIENWEKKKTMYGNKGVVLKHRIVAMENDRSRIDSDYAFTPVLNSYYKRLDSLYKQLHTLSAKINKCTDHISTLKMCLSWS